MCKKFTAATLSALIAVPTIILACIMHGCAVSEHIPERTVVVNMNSDGIVGNDYVSKAFTIERLLPLKTSGIASADKLDIRNGRLYVLDGALHRLWAFSLDGDSLMCINKRGHAGDEYMGITDFAVGDNGDITIYDANSAKIVRYDANGRFKNSVGLDYADGFLLRKNGNAVLLYNRAGKATLTEYAPDGKELCQTECDVAETPLRLSYLGGVAEQGDSVLFTVPFDHTVYAMAGGAVTPKYRFEFPGHRIPDDLWADDKKAALRKLGNTDGVLHIDRLELHSGRLFMSTNSNIPIVYDIARNEARAIGNLKLPYSVLYSGKLTATSGGYVLAPVSHENMERGLYPVLNKYLDSMPSLAPLKDLSRYGGCYWVVVAKINDEKI